MSSHNNPYGPEWEAAAQRPVTREWELDCIASEIEFLMAALEHREEDKASMSPTLYKHDVKLFSTKLGIERDKLLSWIRTNSAEWEGRFTQELLEKRFTPERIAQSHWHPPVSKVRAMVFGEEVQPS